MISPVSTRDYEKTLELVVIMLSNGTSLTETQKSVPNLSLLEIYNAAIQYGINISISDSEQQLIEIQKQEQTERLGFSITPIPNSKSLHFKGGRHV